MSPRVELIYDADCPNVGRAREVIASAMTELGLRPHWVECDRMDPAAPAYVSSCASPTVLVDGRDVLRAEMIAAAACRVYANGEGRLVGVPPLSAVIAALRAAGPRNGS